MVDLVIVGQFVGNTGSVDVNTGGEMADLVAPIAMGFSTAGQIYIAQLYGAGDQARIKKTIGSLLTFVLLVAFALIGVALCFKGAILDLLNCPQEALGEATSYMVITAFGYPFIFGYNAVCGALRGMGESKKPLYFICIAAIINVVLDLVFVAVFKMSAAGSAIATVMSQFGSFAAAFYFLWANKEKFDFDLKLSYFKMDRHITYVLFKLGIPQVCRSMLVRVGMIWVNASANDFGLIVSTTNGIGNKLQKFLEVLVQGIDTASASMIGQNLGAKNTKRAGKITLYTCACALCCAAFSAVLCIFFPHQIFGIFTQDETVIDLGATFLRIFVIHFFASAVTGSFQAMVTGCGFVSLGFVLGTLDGVICKIGFSVLFMYVFNMGYEGLWWGVACSRIIPGMICIGYYLSGKWKTRKLLTD